MNWKEHAHLFANGKFKILFGEKIISEFNHFQLGQVIENPDWYTLIARKIENMTDRELNETLPSNWETSYDGIREELNILIESKAITSTDFLYLISIGVYPFDQSHFENGTVIDIKTL